MHRKIVKLTRIVFLLRPAVWAMIGTALIASCAQAPQPAAPFSSLPYGAAGVAIPPAEYRLNVNDEVELRFPEHPELNQSQRLPPDGRLTVPYLGTVRGEGRTVDEVRDGIKLGYRELSREQKRAGKEDAWEYRIRIEDELDIRFPFKGELNQTPRVRPDGKISLMLVGSMAVEGLTTEELSVRLRQAYGQHLKRPELTLNVRSASPMKGGMPGREVRLGLDQLEPVVILRDHAPLKLYVGGEVVRPGVVPYRGRITLLEALIEAGGHRPTAELASVMILRKQADGPPLLLHRDLRYDMNSVGAEDVWLEPFDIVIVPKTRIATVVEVVDQYLIQLLPFLRNSSLGFTYYLNETTTNVKNQ